MTLFYSVHQHKDQNVNTWRCRLEYLLYRAKQQLSKVTTKSMLLNKFNNGLLKPIKDRIRHLEEKITNFDDLRVAARKMEVELAVQNTGDAVKSKSGDTKSMKWHTKMTKATADIGVIDLPSLVCSLQSRVEEFEQKNVHHKSNVRTHSYSNNNNFHRQPSAHQRSFYYRSSFHQQPSSFNRQLSSNGPL